MVELATMDRYARPVNAPANMITIYKHTYPNLAKIGIPSVYYNGSRIAGYDAMSLPRYLLEHIYRRVFSPVPNWIEIINHPSIDVDTIKIEYLRYTGKNLYYDTKESILRQITDTQLFKEIPELSQQIILQPGGTQYLKYVSTLGEYKQPPKPRELSMEGYTDFYQMCEDPTKDRFHATLFAISLGISDQIHEGMTKEDICKLIINTLNIIRESKRL